MPETPTISVLEPAGEQSQRRAAAIAVKKESQFDPESFKEHLKEIRQHARENHTALIEQFKTSLRQYPGVKLTIAANAGQAAAYIRHVAQGAAVVSLNKSNVVINELRPALQDSTFETYLRYFTEFQNFEKFEKKIDDYWGLPGFHERGLVESFEVRKTLKGLGSAGTRDYVAILGVNAVSAEDGSVFFLQHMSNISKDLEQARHVILVVSLEKAVRNTEAAIFQTRCMGIFGLESVLLDLAPNEVEEYDFASLPMLSGDQDRELHVIIFDNGRSELLQNAYEDLFLCVDCRACARQCPIGLHLVRKGWVYSPKNYLFGFLQGWLPPTEACLHCGRCHVECPVDIDIPTLIWKAQCEYYARRGRSWKKRLLDQPERLAKLGSLTVPLSNWAMEKSISRAIIQALAGIHRKAKLPTFRRQTFKKWLGGGGRG